MIAATLAKAIGPAMRSWGGKAMHAAAPGMRKEGSKALRSTDAKLEQGIQKIVKNTIKLPAILGKLGKFITSMSRHSPALKQQLIVLNKGISLFLRPIGDIMAKFIRPMAIWTITVAKKWYNMFSKKKEDKDGKDGENPPVTEDEVKAAKDKYEALSTAMPESPEAIEAKENYEGLQLEFDMQNIDTEELYTFFDKTNEKIAELNAAMDESTLSQAIEKANEFWNTVLSNVGNETWNSIVETGKAFWQVLTSLYEVLKPVLNIIGTIVKIGLIAVLQTVAFAFEGLTVILKLVSGALKLITLGWTTLKMVFSNFMDGLPEILDYLMGFPGRMWTEITTGFNETVSFFDTLFAGVKKGFQKFYNSVINIINKLPGVNIGKKALAVGGKIDKTGDYLLHAGERVIPAGEANRTANERNISINNIININATLNNDLDIENLARRLAELNETELRRRVSYM